MEYTLYTPLRDLTGRYIHFNGHTPEHLIKHHPTAFVKMIRDEVITLSPVAQMEWNIIESDLKKVKVRKAGMSGSKGFKSGNSKHFAG